MKFKLIKVHALKFRIKHLVDILYRVKEKQKHNVHFSNSSYLSSYCVRILLHETEKLNNYSLYTHIHVYV